MNKIFRYELRRLLWNKLFFGILLVSLGYGWLTLTSSVVRGVAHTAPFSPWSFGYYLSQALPLICLGELFFLAFFFSKEERLLRPLTQATPVNQRRYAAQRCGVVLTATLVLCLCVAALAVGFYVSLFGWVDYGELILPALLTLIPPIVFCLGVGMMLGLYDHTLIYALMAAVILSTTLPLPPAINFSLSGFFSRFPLTVEELDPAFHVPGWLAVSKIVFAFLGSTFTISAINVQDYKLDKFK